MNQKKIQAATWLLLLVCSTSTLRAQDIFLDPAFGSGGKVFTAMGNIGDQANAIAIQPDGKILYGGHTRSTLTSSDFAIARCNPDGSVDTTFGVGGKAITYIENQSEGKSLAIQQDGRIILGGHSSWYINLARYLSDGKPDSSFGEAGTIITDLEGYYAESCRSVLIQPDGKIIVAGYASHFSNDKQFLILLRYHTNGTRDSTFGINGVTIGRKMHCHSAALQNDGKIVLGGSSDNHFTAVRYLTNGIIDSSFGVNGEVATPIGLSSEARSLLIQPDGKIVLGGYSFKEVLTIAFALSRYHPSGNLDSSFGTGGIVTHQLSLPKSWAYTIGLQQDGKIISGGYSIDSSVSAFALARYQNNGDLDHSFGINGEVITPLSATYSQGTSLGIQNDGRIIMGGYAHIGSKLEMALVRYKSTGNSGVEESGNLVMECTSYPNPAGNSVTISFQTKPVDACLTLYTMKGEVIKTMSTITEQKITLPLHGMPSGTYFLHLTERNKLIAVKKLIIEQ